MTGNSEPSPSVPIRSGSSDCMVPPGDIPGATHSAGNVIPDSHLSVCLSGSGRVLTARSRYSAWKILIDPDWKCVFVQDQTAAINSDRNNPDHSMIKFRSGKVPKDSFFSTNWFVVRKKNQVNTIVTFGKVDRLSDKILCCRVAWCCTACCV